MKAFVAAMAMWLCCLAAQPRQVFSATVKEAGEVTVLTHATDPRSPVRTGLAETRD